MTIDLYYAVSKQGQGRIFTSLPIRSNSFKCWIGNSDGAISSVFMLMESEGLEVPNLTWKDEPVKLTLELKFV